MLKAYCGHIEKKWPNSITTHRIEFGQTLSHRIEWDKFPDDTNNILIYDIELVGNKNVLFLGTFGKDKLAQISVLYVFCERHVASLTVLYPFMDTGTMERINDDRIATDKGNHL